MNHLMSTFLLWSFQLLMAIVLFVFSNQLTPFLGISGAAYLLVFFVFGGGLQRFLNNIRSSIILILSFIITLAGIMMIQLKLIGVLLISNKYFRILELLSGLVLGLLLFRFRRGNRFLIFLGSFSFSIYLFHVMFTSAIRIVFYTLNFSNDKLLFFTSLAGGIIFPVFVAIVFRKHFITRRFMLGER